MRKMLFAMLLTLSLVLVGCGETENLGGTVTNDASNTENADESNNAEAAVENDNEEENEVNQVIVDNDSYKVTLLEILKKTDEIFGDSIEVVYEVENHLDKTITLQARDVSADGYMVDETLLSMSQDVVGGKKAKAVLSIHDFEGYDFPELEEDIEMVLHIFDAESWDTIEDHEVKVSF